MTSGTRDVVIVGGGIAGIGTAYYLAHAGIKSTVIEKDGLASHASGFAWGGLSGGIPNGPQPNYPMIELGMALHRQLAKDLPGQTDVDIQFLDRELMRIALNDAEAEALHQNLAWQQDKPGYKVEWLEPGAVKKIEPRVNDEVVGAMHMDGAADVEPYRLTLALAGAAEKLGVTIRSGEVTALHHHNGRLSGVAIGDEEIGCDMAVLAMGPWMGQAESWLGMSIPVRPLKGQILRLKAPGAPYNLSIGHLKNYAMTKPADGLVWCGTTEEEVGFDESNTIEARDSIIDSVLKMLPALADADLALQTACLRPVTPDNTVIVGEAPSVSGVYLNTGAGRQGIMMGPAMAKVTADLIVGAEPALDLAPFSPSRFPG